MKLLLFAALSISLSFATLAYAKLRPLNFYVGQASGQLVKDMGHLPDDSVSSSNGSRTLVYRFSENKGQLVITRMGRFSFVDPIPSNCSVIIEISADNYRINEITKTGDDLSICPY